MHQFLPQCRIELAGGTRIRNHDNIHVREQVLRMPESFTNLAFYSISLYRFFTDLFGNN